MFSEHLQPGNIYPGFILFVWKGCKYFVLPDAIADMSLILTARYTWWCCLCACLSCCLCACRRFEITHFNVPPWIYRSLVYSLCDFFRKAKLLFILLFHITQISPNIFRQFHVSKRRHVTSERLKSPATQDFRWLSVVIDNDWKTSVNLLVTISPVPGQVLLRVLGWLLICSSYGSTLSGLPLTHSLHSGTGSVGIVQEVNIWYTLTWMEKVSHWLLVALLLSAAGPHWMGHLLLRSLYEHGLNLIKPWICDHIPSKMWDGITYPFPNFNGVTVEGNGSVISSHVW